MRCSITMLWSNLYFTVEKCIICRRLDSNWIPLVSEATTPSTEPQPLPKFNPSFYIVFWKIRGLGYNFNMTTFAKKLDRFTMQIVTVSFRKTTYLLMTYRPGPKGQTKASSVTNWAVHNGHIHESLKYELDGVWPSGGGLVVSLQPFTQTIQVRILLTLNSFSQLGTAPSY